MQSTTSRVWTFRDTISQEHSTEYSMISFCRLMEYGEVCHWLRFDSLTGFETVCRWSAATTGYLYKVFLLPVVGQPFSNHSVSPGASGSDLSADQAIVRTSALVTALSFFIGPIWRIWLLPGTTAKRASVHANQCLAAPGIPSHNEKPRSHKQGICRSHCTPANRSIC